MKDTIDKLVIEFFDLENSEWAQEYEQENGKIETIEELETYLKDTFDNPLSFVLEKLTEHLESSN